MPTFLEHLYWHQVRERHASVSYYMFRNGPAVVGQGADGLSFYSPNLSGIRAFARRAIECPQLRVMDDLWICAFLWHRGIAVKSLGHLLPKGGTAYDLVHAVDQLRNLDGELRRADVKTCGWNFMLETGLLGHRRQLIAMAKKAIRGSSRRTAG